jgi:hypothetical protein
MPKAEVTTATGTVVTIEGSVEEVAKLTALLSAGAGTPATTRRAPRRRGAATPTTGRSSAGGPIGRVRALIAEDFFASKREIRDVQGKLEETGHIYPLGHLSPTLVRLVRSRELRRMKEGRSWKYVNP